MVVPYLDQLAISSVLTVLVVVGSISLYLANRRFFTGELFNIVKWMSFAFFVFAIYEIIELTFVIMLSFTTYAETYRGLLINLQNILFLIAIIFAVRTALLINKFSKLVGFREAPAIPTKTTVKKKK